MSAIIGVDTLAGVKFPDEIAQLNKKYATSYFWEEFGRAREQITDDHSSGRSMIRVQGLWAGKSHDYNDKHRARALQIARALDAIAKAKGKRIYYSPFCEHKKDAQYMSKLLGEIQDRFVNLIAVNSPIKGGQWVNGFVNEIHHNDKPAGMPKGLYIFSMDGLHQPDCDITNYTKYLLDPNCIAFYVWALQDNCKRNAKDTTPAKARKCKPTHDLHLSMIFQLENAKQRCKLNAGHVIKTHSEQHNDVDPRANKLVYIGPKGARPKSVRVGKLQLTSAGFTPDDNRPVFRSSKWAYKLGRVVKVVVDSKSVGTVDQPFRENEWREKT
jgi:hypothetical protein